MDLASETLNFSTFDLQFDCFSSRDLFLPNFDTKETDRSSSDVDSSSNLFETGGWLDDSFRQTSYSSPETTPGTSDFSTTNSTYDVHLKPVSKVDPSKQYYFFQTSQLVSSSCQQESLESKSSSPLQDFSSSCISNKTFICSYCNKQFTSEKYLSMHVSLHNVRSISGESNNIQLIVEEFKNQGICPIERSKGRGGNKLASWTCKICLKTFAQNSNYKNHIRTHSNERPFVCNICSIGFKERYHLKKHVLFVHTSEMKEKCKVCGKKFKDSTAVRAHERTHSDLRPYTCPRCNKAFKTSECLWHHENRSKACMKNYPKTGYTIDPKPEVTSGSNDAAIFEPVDHKLLQEVKCPVEFSKKTDTCINFYENIAYQQEPVKTELHSGYSNDYSNNSSLNSSRTQVIPGYGRDDSTISGTTYNRETSGTLPASEAGKLICEHCDKVFVSVGAYKKHASSHTLDRPYRCEFCNVGFKLKVHLKKHNLYKHTDKFLCECRFCGKRFKDSSAVKLHERIHSEERPFQCQCGKSFKTRENLWGHQHRGPCELAYQMTKLPEEANMESWQTPCSDYIETNNDLVSNSSSIITSHEAYQTSDTIPNEFLNSHKREIDTNLRIRNNWKHPDDGQKQSMIHVAPDQHSIIPTAVVVPMKRNPSIIFSPENSSPLKNSNATAFLPPFESFKPESFVDLSSSKNVFLHDSSRTIQNPDVNQQYADFTLQKKLPDIQCMLQSFPQMRFTPVLSEQNHTRAVLEEPSFDTNRIRQGPWTGSKMSSSFDAYHKRSTFGRQLHVYQTRQEFQNILYPTSTMY